jgi:single-stranded-DNA-specific exonuclease
MANLATFHSHAGMTRMPAIRPVVARRVPDAGIPSGLRSVDPLFARLYATRGVLAADELDYALARIAPVGVLDKVDAAVDLLLANRSRKIVVIGDFDVDGATSTALMLRAMAAFGFSDVEYLVPNRFDFGYGLTPDIVRVAAKREPSLIVTVDNGISSGAGVREARASGIAALITDHHLPGSELPDADVIVNPNLSGSRFPSRNLAGVGVAFYVMAALGRRLEREGMAGAAKIPARYLDLVALGTVADVVPLDYNNRILVKQGIDRIRAGHTVPGIRALLELAGRETSRAVSGDLGFAVGPRLNAAGRLEDMALGIDCLLTDDPAVAARHAAVLDDINHERREIESAMREQAFAYVDSMHRRDWPPCVCVYDRNWHQGIVGLIAARVRERCHRPVVAFARDSDGQLKGSMRSVPGVHARDLIEAASGTHPDLVPRFGGHAMAAGLTIAEQDYEAFAEAIAVQVGRLYPQADFSGAIVADGVLTAQAVARFGGLLPLARGLRDAGPWGSGFPEPLWVGDFEVLEQRTVGQSHAKLRVRALDGGAPVDAIAFNQSVPAQRGPVRLAFRLDVNRYGGSESAQLVVEQIAGVTARGT